MLTEGENKMPSGVKIDWDKTELEYLYWTKKLSCTDIGALKGLHGSAVMKAMVKFGIKRRSLSEVHKLLYAKGGAPPLPHGKGSNHPRWKGGRRITLGGYVLVYCPEHPRQNRGTVFEHIVVWEKTHGCSIPLGYHIHHLNGIKQDNRPENLEAVPNKQHEPFTFIRALQQRIRDLESALATVRNINGRREFCA